tara:strand:+ start:85 stop:447 length:363 start_codon:yes stop_codon:yes gene_type:complete
MAKIIKKPAIIESAGNKPKIIKEFIGLINSSTENISIAQMESPPGWEEPGQTPEFNEYTIVIEGKLQVETKKSMITVNPGEAIITYSGEWVRYSTPSKNGAKYIAVCSPAFSSDTVNRDS